MPERDEPHKSAAELLAEWRAAGRDAVAAKAAARGGTLALTAAEAALQAANEVETAAGAALQAVDLARAAATRAKTAAGEAAATAADALAEAQGDKADANRHVELAEAAEKLAGEAYHEADRQGFPK